MRMRVFARSMTAVEVDYGETREKTRAAGKSERTFTKVLRYKEILRGPKESQTLERSMSWDVL